MLIPNLVKDCFLKDSVKGAVNLYIRKTGGQLILIATFYEEWHAIFARRVFRAQYELPINQVSKDDYLYELPNKEKAIREKVHKLNMRSHNKLVRQHEQLRQELLTITEKPDEWASRLLKEMNEREAKVSQ